ncbi:phosphatase PAP2 family protein [Effusibacillus consociatus]|uniref:Phosphatase PAP2 family protein n=1 Tax=Effusibacillus consociatus TaxID=1117041 RepID=A0ABV9Q446_9BACL
MQRVITYIRERDRKLITSLLRLRGCAKLNLLMRTCTVFGGALFTVGAVVVLLFVTEGRGKQASMVAAAALAGSFLLVQWIKRMVKRFRPYLVMAEIKLLGTPLKDHSFPSGHTTSIFSIVTAFVITFPTLAVWCYALATLVAVSRIYLGFHYPTDVLAGIIIGVGFSIGSHAALHAWLL